MLLQVHSSDVRKPEKDSKPAASSEDQGHINVASRLPTQQSNAAVVGQTYEQQHANQGEARGSQHQQQQFLEQQPRKPGPNRGLVEEFLPPGPVVGHMYEQQRAKEGEVRASRQQQAQFLEQQPRKAGPSRGLIEEFLPPAPVVSVGVYEWSNNVKLIVLLTGVT